MRVRLVVAPIAVRAPGRRVAKDAAAVVLVVLAAAPAGALELMAFVDFEDEADSLLDPPVEDFPPTLPPFPPPLFPEEYCC